MSNRLHNIVTKTGDTGSTGLSNLERRSKADVRIHALGDIDELNAQIGMLLTGIENSALQAMLVRAQHNLFDIGAELALPNRPAEENFSEAAIIRLEKGIDAYQSSLEPLKEFILPGGSVSAAQAHICRTVCRRAERSLVALHTQEPLNPFILAYVNRLSDLFFILARVLNRMAKVSDVLWNKH